MSRNWYANNAEVATMVKKLDDSANRPGWVTMEQAIRDGRVLVLYHGVEYAITDRNRITGRYSLRQWDSKNQRVSENSPAVRIRWDDEVYPISDPVRELKAIRSPLNEAALVEALDNHHHAICLGKVTNWIAARDLSEDRKDRLFHALAEVAELMPTETE